MHGSDDFLMYRTDLVVSAGSCSIVSRELVNSASHDQISGHEASFRKDPY